MKLMLLPFPLLLAGCAAADAGYPSLSPRAAERTGFAEPTVAPTDSFLADPALDLRIAELTGKLDTVAKGFAADAARAAASAGVAGARTVGSDAWLTAQTALAQLDDWRAQASGLATDAEALGSERAASVGTPYPALDAVRERAAAEAERESGAITALSTKVPTP